MRSIKRWGDTRARSELPWTISLTISEDEESSTLCGKEKIDFGLNSSFYSCCNRTQESHFILHREKLKTRNRGCILMKERGGGKIHINDVTRCALQWAHGWPNMWSRSDDVFKARREYLKHAQNSPLNVFFSSMHHRQHRVFNCSVAASIGWWLHLKFKYCNFTLSSRWTRPSSDAPKTDEMARRKHPSEELSPRHAAVFRLETLMLFSVMQLQLCCRVNSRSPGRKESSELCNREEWRKMKKIPCQNRNVCMSSVVSILRCRLFSSFPRQGSDGLLRVVRAEEWERLIKGD